MSEYERNLREAGIGLDELGDEYESIREELTRVRGELEKAEAALRNSPTIYCEYSNECRCPRCNYFASKQAKEKR